MCNKKKYYITDKEVTKVNNGYFVSYVYAGENYWVQGEFYIDTKNYLHHSHFTKRGKEIPFKIKLAV
jgi:hypothetical protein